MPLTAEQLHKLRRLRAVNGSRVGAAIKLAGLTQAAVAHGTGLTQPYVSDVARGRYPSIHLDNARIFAAFFGCAVDDLFPAASHAAVNS